DVEILHNLPPSFYKGTQTCLDGEEKSKPKSRLDFQGNSKTNKTVQEHPNTFVRQKDKLARVNNLPSIQNIAFARPAKMPKLEHKGQLSSKMTETRNLNCSFKPPQDMRLSEDLVNMAMYIFAADNDIA
ncbi:hypothetical protein S245_001430, partial [Arachis hypogaea]